MSALQTYQAIERQRLSEDGIGRHLIPVGPERLTEPDLSYFLALRAQFHASQVQTSTLGQALQVLVGAISRARGLDESVSIDAEGFLHHTPPAEPAQESDR